MVMLIFRKFLGFLMKVGVILLLFGAKVDTFNDIMYAFPPSIPFLSFFASDIRRTFSHKSKSASNRTNLFVSVESINHLISPSRPEVIL